MSDLERGALVQHSTLGLGKVVALECDAVHVFFPGRGERFAAKLRLPGARAFLRTGLEERDTWLEGLSSFTLDANSGRWALPARWLTLDQVVAQFLDGQPKGFTPGIPGRAATWRAAHQAFVAAVGNGEAERLLEAEDERELVRRLLKVAKLVSPLHAEEDRDAIEDALGDDEQTARFLWALFELLSVPSPGRARFDKLFSAASGLPGAPGSRWLVVTLFPFLGRPDRHPIMHPGSTLEAAERLGFELKFDDTPNWSTLSALRAHSERMLKSLAPSGAKDYVDVEVFFHAASKMRASGAKRVAKRAAKAAAKVVAVPQAAAAKAAASPAPKAAPAAAKTAAPKGAEKKVAAKPVAKAIAKPAKKPAPKAAKKPVAKKAAAPAKKVAKPAGRRSAA